ncbi:MAG: hypothetical protein ABIT08_02570 [Bacteroidia bacterium]
MKNIDNNKDFIFRYRSELVQVSEREQGILTTLIDRYGNLARVPKEEVISVNFLKKSRNKFVWDEKFFYVEVNELKPVNEKPDKRRGVLLNFFNRLKIKG